MLLVGKQVFFAQKLLIALRKMLAEAKVSVVLPLSCIHVYVKCL